MNGTESKRLWRLKNPMKAAYQTMKYNATRRGVPFEISFEYFRRFAFKTRLLTKRGRTPESFCVDRIDNERGYIEGNLAVLTFSDNGYKGYLEREIYWEDAGEGRGQLKRKLHKPDLRNHPF